MNKKFVALAATSAIALSGLGSALAPVGAFAASEPAGNPVVIAGNAPTQTSYADALAAYNTALAVYKAAAADTTATKPSVQQAFQNARAAYNAVARAIMAARSSIDQTFRDAIKTANTAYRAARKAATTAQAKIDADNAFQVAVAAASSARDTEYAKYPLPAMPMPMTNMGKQGKGENGGMMPGDSGSPKGK